MRKAFAEALERAADGRELSREDLQVLLGADEQESASLLSWQMRCAPGLSVKTSI